MIDILNQMFLQLTGGDILINSPYVFLVALVLSLITYSPLVIAHKLKAHYLKAVVATIFLLSISLMFIISVQREQYHMAHQCLPVKEVTIGGAENRTSAYVEECRSKKNIYDEWSDWYVKKIE